MKKLLALVVIAGSITLVSCGNGDKKTDDAAAAKAKADSTRIADSTAKAKAADSAMKAKAAMDTTKKADSTKKDAPKADTKMDAKKK